MSQYTVSCNISNHPPADLLAAVRAAVEDGTIQGEVNQIEDRTYLVIPVSDGGSET
jgi:hypothetical protein